MRAFSLGVGSGRRDVRRRVPAAVDAHSHRDQFTLRRPRRSIHKRVIGRWARGPGAGAGEIARILRFQRELTLRRRAVGAKPL
jgi:hypothetical protein